MDSVIVALHYQAWRTHPEAIERHCAARESFTDAQARELVREVRADSDRTDAQNEPPAGASTQGSLQAGDPQRALNFFAGRLKPGQVRQYRLIL
jgi:hypothetical protein